MKYAKLCLLFPLMLAASACQTQADYTYREIPPVAIKNVNGTDVNNAMHELLNQMFSAQTVKIVTNNQRPSLFIGDFQNETEQTLDSFQLDLTMKRYINYTGKFAPLSQDEMAIANQLLKSNPHLNLFDPSTSIYLGNRVNVQYILHTTFAPVLRVTSQEQSIFDPDYFVTSSETPVEVNDYRLSMSLINLKTGLTEWSDSRLIRARD